MRSLLGLIACLSLLPPAFADAGTSKTDARNRRKADQVYIEAVEYIQAGNIEKGKRLLDEALKIDPENVPAVTARELLRQHEVQQKVTEANRALQAEQSDKAIAAFREALALDPRNPRAQEGLSSALSQSTGGRADHPAIRYRDADAIQLEPAEGNQDFHFKGDTRGLLQLLWNAYGIKPVLDNSVTSKQLRFDVEDADFATAITLASQMTRSFYVPISKNQALIVADTAENRKNFERLAMRTFYIGEASTQGEINDVVTMLKTIFDLRYVTPAANSNQVVVRAPLTMLDAATRILEDLYSGKPQVMLDLSVYQVEQTLAQDIGIGLPTQLTLFNVNTEAAKLVNSGNQNLINQLIASGAINQANASSISSLLAGLAAASGAGSILNQPFATFGGGISRSGVIIPATTIHFSLNKSSLQTLDHVMLRAAENDPATFRDGTRYPILNATFAPIFNTPAISQVLQNQSFAAPFPSFSYEDLGLTLKATPTIHGTDVSLKLEFQLRGLGATQLNGVPVITNRQYSGSISVPIGETAVLAGMVSKSEQLTLQGIPGLAQLPVLGAATSVRNKQRDDAELLITIQPHLVREAVHHPENGTAFLPVRSAQ